MEIKFFRRQMVCHKPIGKRLFQEFWKPMVSNDLNRFNFLIDRLFGLDSKSIGLRLRSLKSDWAKCQKFVWNVNSSNFEFAMHSWKFQLEMRSPETRFELLSLRTSKQINLIVKLQFLRFSGEFLIFKRMYFNDWSSISVIGKSAIWSKEMFSNINRQ